MKHQRIVNGVIVDDTELHNQIEHWKQMYIREIKENMKLYKGEKSTQEKVSPKIIKCCKCNGDMKFIEDFGFYVCLSCGNTEVNLN